MAVTTSQVIHWTLLNFSAAMLLIAVLIIPFDILIHFFRRRSTPAEIIFRWVSLLALGAAGIYAFVVHSLFGNIAAATIGWGNSPFQFEVAVADLAFGILGVLAFWPNFGFRVATTIGATIWLWGDAFGHIYQMVVARNFSIGNAGSWFWLDILVPFILIGCIIKMSQEQRKNNDGSKVKYERETTFTLSK